MESMGLAIDWSREMTACKPDYYKWNQWMFLKMLEKGIIYQKTGTVNWDPVDQTVLANEQVVDGRGWRSGALIEKREIPMYYVRITDYADELLDYVDNKLPGWPERVRIMQANWIGKSTGVRFAFPHVIMDEQGELINDGKLYVFTTRADTIMGVTFCAVAAEHPLATHAAKDNPELQAFIAECKQGSVIEADMATMEKKGMPTGLFVTHPVTGEQVPVWVGNYVLMTYGDGAVMGVPAHDERDFAFAQKYSLPIKQVVAVEGQDLLAGRLAGVVRRQGAGRADRLRQVRRPRLHRRRERGGRRPGREGPGRQEGHLPPARLGHLAPALLGHADPDDPLREVRRGAGSGKGPAGRAAGRLRPGRQRQPAQEARSLPEGRLPVLRQARRAARPTPWTPSSTRPGTTCAIPRRARTTRWSTPRNDYWMPMDQYIGGIEHAVLHLLYARFWTKVMRDFGLVKFDEPFVNLLTQGMVLNETYYREDESGKKTWFNPADVDLCSTTAAARRRGIEAGRRPGHHRRHREDVEVEEQRHRPAAQIEQYGADTARLFTMFAAPPEQTLEWSESGVEGASRFLRRVWAFAYAQRERIAAALAGQQQGSLDDAQKTLRREVHKILQQADYDFKRIQYNTVVSACMKMLNTLESAKLDEGVASDAVIAEGLSIFLRMLNPVAPHITHALWQELGYAGVYGDILNVQWPQVDPAALEQSEIELMIQVNGKLRGSIKVPKEADKAAIEAAALASEAVQKFIEGTPKKIIVVPGKLINIVV
jgi:leucyl-tRNA synthetase